MQWTASLSAKAFRAKAYLGPGWQRQYDAEQGPSSTSHSSDLGFSVAVRQKKASEFHRRDGGRSHPYSAVLPLDVFEENPATQIHRKYFLFL